MKEQRNVPAVDAPHLQFGFLILSRCEINPSTLFIYILKALKGNQTSENAPVLNYNARKCDFKNIVCTNSFNDLFSGTHTKIYIMNLTFNCKCKTASQPINCCVVGFRLFVAGRSLEGIVGESTMKSQILIKRFAWVIIYILTFQ